MSSEALLTTLASAGEKEIESASGAGLTEGSRTMAFEHPLLMTSILAAALFNMLRKSGAVLSGVAVRRTEVR